MQDREPFDLKLARDCARAFSAASGLGCVVSDAAGVVHYEAGFGCASCQICVAAGRRPEDCAQAHIYGMSESTRFGGKYIYFCPMGLTCFVSPILGDTSACAKLTVGPFLMVDRQDYISCDLQDHLHLEPQHLRAVAEALEQVPYLPAERVNDLSNLLFMAVGFLNNVSESERMLRLQDSGQIQGQITGYIQHLKRNGAYTPYSFEMEQALLRAVRQANREQAQRLLNDLLGHILFSSGGEFPQIKARINELLVLISRAAVEAGASPDQTLDDCQRYHTELGRILDFDALCLWLTQVLNNLMDGVFQFSGMRHTSLIHQSIQYINTHYAERLTLEDMARLVYLSPAYFSRVFKQEVGESFTGYLNRVRIDHSRSLLRRKELRLVDIALMVGFEDQSYFTKVFKKITGLSPLQYREGKKT